MKIGICDDDLGQLTLLKAQIKEVCAMRDISDISITAYSSGNELLESELVRMFDLVFLDPPYEAGLLEKAIAQIARYDLLAPHGIMVAECPVDKNLPALSAPYGIYREYRYGKIKLTVYHRDGNEAQE